LNIEFVLGRAENSCLIEKARSLLLDCPRRPVLITGGNGSLGKALANVLSRYDWPYISTDIQQMNVLDTEQIDCQISDCLPFCVFHLAGAKHAPDGEAKPEQPMLVNALGTYNLLESIERLSPDSNCVTASTCKASDPETAYGASKLLAERMALRYGFSVSRFYNVVESSDNVFSIWDKIDKKKPIPYTSCERYFISLDEAISLLVVTSFLPRGRYTVDPGLRVDMRSLARRLYPDRELVQTPRRYGDRVAEPRKSASETLNVLSEWGVERIENYHDVN